MGGLTKFILRRPVTAILSVICLVVFGFMSIRNMTLELTPDMDMSMMIVMTSYSGASAEDVAELVTKPIENSVSTLSGLDSMSSTSSEGSSRIMLSYDYGTDMDDAYDEVKKKVDQIKSSLPDDCSTPQIISMNMNSSEDIRLNIENSGYAEEDLYNYVKDRIKPEFEKLADVADVSLRGGRQKYVSITLNEEAMKQYGVTMSSIVADLKAADATIPGGSTKEGSQEYSVSTRMNYKTMELLSEIPLTTSDNSIVYLGDVATVEYAQKSSSSISRYDGKGVVSIGLSKQQSSTAMSISNAVKKTAASLEAADPNLKITVVDDNADSIMDSLTDVAKTLVLAVIISMIVIWLFFGDLKASMIVGSSIPCSILAALICMYFMNFSLNVVTLAALSLGVGMMVDNSIVVLESCFRATSRMDTRAGLIEYARSALEGTNIVGLSVAASTATTCVVFIPLALISGMAGQMFKPLGFTIVFCMVASLLSAITVVPLCYMLYQPKEREKAPFNRPILSLQDGYRKLMKKVLPHSKLAILLSIVLFVGSIFLASNLTMELMSADDNGEVSISVKTRPGIQLEKMEPILNEIEEIVTADPDVEHYSTSFSSGGMRGSSSASITCELKDDRELSTDETVTKFQKELADITNCTISVSASGSMSMMSDRSNSYSVLLQGADYSKVKEVTNKIVSELKGRDDVTRVHSSIENSSPVIAVDVDAIRAKANGLTASQIGNAVYSALSGSSPINITVDGEDVSVTVEYPEDAYADLSAVKNILLTNSKKGQVALTDVADVHYEDSPASISREDKQYRVTISASYTDKATRSTQQTIFQEVVQPNLSDQVTTGVNSRDRSRNSEFESLGGALAIAVFLIFVVMASQFESVKYSAMVMTTIPFSVIGSFALLWLTDVSLSMVALIGFLMLIGTAVNNGILYVDTTNQYRATMDMDTALVEAGATRMRPILMTTMTTVLSMIPLALGVGSSGSYTQALALVNIGGLITSTILCLIVLPGYYKIMSGGKALREDPFADID